MNTVREINRINQAELELAVAGGAGSWHDEYKDSAYIYVGGLPLELTEGDVITIFSQYGEILDVNLPREKDTGKKRGFGFLMYEDQRSTVLAVDNLNGAKVLERTLRVDHVRSYKQPKVQGQDGTMEEREEPSMNAAPQPIQPTAEASPEPEADLDLEDPMAAYFAAQKKSSSSKDPDKARAKEEKRRRKEERELKRMRRAERHERHEHRDRDGHRRRSPSPRPRGDYDKYDNPAPSRSSHSERTSKADREPRHGRSEGRDREYSQERDQKHRHRSRSRSPRRSPPTRARVEHEHC